MVPYSLVFKKKEEVAERTTAFYFEKPAGFEFKAAQFMFLTLIDPPEMDAEGPRRYFSLASAPYEDDLMIATRMRDSAFKRVLGTLPSGAKVQSLGPFGALTLHEDAAQPAIFLAGGIGITPFRSILFQSARSRLPHRLFLFYSNRRPEDAAFLDELKGLEQENPNYTFVGTMTGMERSDRPWPGEQGYIKKEMLAKFIKDLKAPIYYIAGPPSMVDAIQKVLEESGVDRGNVRVEKFAGY